MRRSERIKSLLIAEDKIAQGKDVGGPYSLPERFTAYLPEKFFFENRFEQVVYGFRIRKVIVEKPHIAQAGSLFFFLEFGYDAVRLHIEHFRIYIAVVSGTEVRRIPLRVYGQQHVR